MSAALLMAGPADSYRITVGNGGGSSSGPYNGSNGAIDHFTIFGGPAQLGQCRSGATEDFLVGVNNQLAAFTTWTQLLVQDGTGAVRVYRAADATLTLPGGTTQWVWGDGSNRVWATTDGDKVVFLQFFR